MLRSLVSIKGVSKKYGKYNALDSVSFNICEGEICGLVGENGTGKTTLIRIMTGLIKQTSGKIIRDQNVKVSCIVESPALYLNLTGFENLNYALKSSGIKGGKQRIKEILNLVGLTHVDKRKKAKDYSLGMRQRLAIGLAIIDTPDLLILDEPINGLDPVGIKELREVLLTLKNKMGITIMVSSHILSELDLVVDRYVIMHKGKVIKDINKEDLKQELKTDIVIETNLTEQVTTLLNDYHIQHKISQSSIVIDPEEYRISDLMILLGSKGIEIDSISNRTISFEDYYLSLIKV